MKAELRHLRDCPLFKPVPDAMLELLAEQAECRRHAPGDIVFVEGADNNEVLLIAEGTVRVGIALANQDETCEVASLGPGEVLGEIAMIRPTVRSATATAETDTLILAWPGQALRNLCERDYEVGYHLLMEVATIMWERLMKADERNLDRVSWGLD